MRLDYVDNPPTNLSSEDQEVLERVKARRGAMGLIPLDLTLLHAPKIADGWNALLGAVRTKNSLPDDIREIAICRPALINKAWFEWNAHCPILLKSQGFSEDKLDVVKQLHPKSKGALDDRQWAVLRYADAMTREVSVPQSLFDEVKAAGLSEQQMVELTATVASYNMVSRFLVALDIGEQNNKKPEWAIVEN
ncbi:AhpD-like protein [Exophiala viscosa]|uniref:AhpD-like protein n=1 Tax=Exophiala viscosa TaxID=2486360 RepID=A0AAN6DS92_9EURO|nr:AhpD-like protein [Exophiala viscosa]KAI1623860.1 AhpD-like protein [Exophiala viscosa]